MKPIHLDGQSLTREQVVAVAYGAPIELDTAQLKKVQRAADFLVEQVAPAGADLRRIHRLRQQRRQTARRASPARRQAGREAMRRTACSRNCSDNLIITHAVCVGEPFAGRRGARDAGDPHQHADARPFRHPRRHAAGAGRDAQRRHRAGGAAEGLGRRQRRPGAAVAPRDRAARRRRSVLPGRAHARRRSAAARRPVADPAVAQGRPGAQQRHRADARHRRARRGAARGTARHRRPRRGDDPRRLRRPHARLRCARARACARIRARCTSRGEPAPACCTTPRWPTSTTTWCRASVPGRRTAGRRRNSRRCASTSAGTGCRCRQRHGRERFYQRFKPFRGGKKHQPQDSYSLRCIPQVHGAVRDALAQAQRVLDIELNSVTDNPLAVPGPAKARATSRTRWSPPATSTACRWRWR